MKYRKGAELIKPEQGYKIWEGFWPEANSDIKRSYKRAFAKKIRRVTKTMLYKFLYDRDEAK